MASSQALQMLVTGTPPRGVRLAAARAMLPLVPAEMLVALVHLTGDPDPEVGSAAEASLGAWPEAELCGLLAAPSCDGAVLARFAAGAGAEAILEAVAGNAATPDDAIAELAGRASPRILERILDNRVRLLRAPRILDAMKANPNVAGEAERIVREIEAEFLESRKSDYSVGSAPADREGAELALPIGTEELSPEDLAIEGLPVDPDQREGALLERLAQMTVRQKIQAALLGNREIRGALVRSANREVSASVLKNPKITDTEVETFSAMRNVSEDVLREIGNSRQWTRHYNVVHNLAKNPKTPALIAQRLLFRLQSKDLALLARDRGVSETVRRNAQRTLSVRNVR